MTWFGICVTYVRFYKGFKVQGFDRSQLPYAHFLQPYAAWYAMFMCLLICFVSCRAFVTRCTSKHSVLMFSDGAGYGENKDVEGKKLDM